jgi:hypothetical protein
MAVDALSVYPCSVATSSSMQKSCIALQPKCQLGSDGELGRITYVTHAIYCFLFKPLALLVIIASSPACTMVRVLGRHR